MAKHYMIQTQDGNYKFAGETCKEAESYAKMAGFEIVEPTEWAEVVVGQKYFYQNIITGEIVIPAGEVNANYYVNAYDYVSWTNSLGA